MRSSLWSLTLAAVWFALPSANFAQDARSNPAAGAPNSPNPAPASNAARPTASSPTASSSSAAAPGAAKPESDMPPEAAAVKKLLETKFPGAAVSNISKSPYFGLYEVQFDDRVIYTDAGVNYVVVGAIYDANTKKNLTEARQRELNRVAWDSLPLDLAFKRVKGNGSRKLVVFADADCPYCKRLEADLKKVNDVTIYTFLFPIDQLHPDAGRKSAVIWCSADRAKAWDEFFASGKLPDNKGDCPTPIKETAALGEKLHVSATPTLIFADGSVIPGAIPLTQLESEINKGEAEAKKLAQKKS